MSPTVRLERCPSRCPHCGTSADSMPLRVNAGEVVIACPACHVAVAPVYAERPDAGGGPDVQAPDTVAMDRIARALNGWGSDAGNWGDILVEILGIVRGTGRAVEDDTDEDDDPECE